MTRKLATQLSWNPPWPAQLAWRALVGAKNMPRGPLLSVPQSRRRRSHISVAAGSLQPLAPPYALWLMPRSSESQNSRWNPTAIAKRLL